MPTATTAADRAARIARRIGLAATLALSVGVLALFAGLAVTTVRPDRRIAAGGFVVLPPPAPGGFVHDGGPVLTAAARRALDARVREVQQTTGGDVAVAVVRDLGGRAPAEAGLAVYRAWKVGAVDTLGSPHRDLGALLLVVPKELAPDHRGECWITTGLGAEGVLTDGRAARICREDVIPRLRRGDHAAALAAGVDEIARAFGEAIAAADSVQDADEGQAPDASAAAAGDAAARADAAAGKGGTAVVAAADSACGRAGGADLPDAVAPDAEPPGEAPSFAGASGPAWAARRAAGFLALGAALLGAAAFARTVRRARPRRCPRGHGPMRRRDEVADDAALTPPQLLEERLASVDYDVWECARCPERVIAGHRRWFSGHEHCARCEARTTRRQVRTVRAVRAATTAHTGLEEHALHCLHCGHGETRTRVVPRRSPGGGARSGGGGGSSGGFGGSGRSSGGGGGSSY